MTLKFDIPPEPDYTVSYATTEGHPDAPLLLGVEIQPKLDTLATEGIAKALMADSSREPYDGGAPLVGEVHITRNDAKGTALAIYRSTANGRTVVEYIANAMNPVGALDIKADPHDYRDKLRELQKQRGQKARRPEAQP